MSPAMLESRVLVRRVEQVVFCSLSFMSFGNTDQAPAWHLNVTRTFVDLDRGVREDPRVCVLQSGAEDAYPCTRRLQWSLRW